MAARDVAKVTGVAVARVVVTSATASSYATMTGSTATRPASTASAAVSSSAVSGSTDGAAAPAADAVTYTAEQTARYHTVADAFLEHLETRVEALLEDHVSDLEVQSSVGVWCCVACRVTARRALLHAVWVAMGAPQYGVLTIRLGKLGSYVINKQSVNLQMWWSSPRRHVTLVSRRASGHTSHALTCLCVPLTCRCSGPKRFNLDPASGRWLSTRDGTDLVVLLTSELQALLPGVRIEL
jgi:frataxin-like iron-binding protein CyaY